jgi:hypothetical protein
MTSSKRVPAPPVAAGLTASAAPALDVAAVAPVVPALN